MSDVTMYLGIDCGTQGTKALVMDADGGVHGRGYAAHALTERGTGAREQEPAWWVAALKMAVTQAVGAAGSSVRIAALGVSGQQHGLVVLDEAMQVIRPAKLWNDTETAPENAELVAHFGGAKAWSERFGIVPLTGYTVSKLLWLKKHEPQNFARVRHVLLPHEYLNFYLTGKVSAEQGDASGTGYFDPRKGEWAREVLDFIDGGTGQLFAALPALRGVDEAVGTVLPAVAVELGLTADCLVASGGGDNMMGAIGTGNVRAGVVTLSLGTSSTVYAFQEHASEDESGCVAPFCASSGGWLPLVCTMNATNVVTQTLNVLGLGVAEIEEALGGTAPGADGLVMIPFFNGERTPDLPGARGNLSGISSNNFTQGNLVRAAVEGVSFGILNGLDLILRGGTVDQILVIGGGSKSAAWRQLLADASGVAVAVPMEEEAGCMGGAMQALYLVTREPFAAIAQRCIRLAPEKGAVPNGGLKAGYDAARAAYAEALGRLY